jgi:hypothetical protein
MPIYEYKNFKTGQIVEKIFSHKERPDQIKNNVTGETAYLIISKPAKMASQWADWQRGLDSHGQYDKELGQTVYGERHRDELLEAKGWVRESDLPKNWVADKMEQQMNYNEHQDKRSDELFGLMQKHGVDKPQEATQGSMAAMEAVWDEWMPAKETLAGEYDKTELKDF